MQMSEFQILTELELLTRLHEAGLTFDRRDFGDGSEPFVQGWVEDVQIWIYQDGEASLVGRGLDLMFEKWDYDSPEALRAALIEALMGLFKGG